MTEMTDNIVRGWVFYDGDCGICTRSMRRVACLLRQRGLRITPLQSTWARRKLRLAGVRSEALLDEMRLLKRGGALAGGGDALIALAREYWWAWPVYAVAAYVPFLRRLIRAGYRKAAASRRCSANGCTVSFDRPRGV